MGWLTIKWIIIPYSNSCSNHNYDQRKMSFLETLRYQTKSGFHQKIEHRTCLPFFDLSPNRSPVGLYIGYVTQYIHSPQKHKLEMYVYYFVLKYISGVHVPQFEFSPSRTSQNKIIQASFEPQYSCQQ